jgi:uncharacterized RDD family membrane protein YckC
VSNEVPLQPYPTPGDEADQLASTAEYARWGRRAGGLLLDTLIIAVLAIVLTALTGHDEPWQVFHLHTVNGQQRLAPIGSRLLFFSGLSVLISFAYNTAFLSSMWQATPGMRAVTVHIARADLGPGTSGAAGSPHHQPQGTGQVRLGRSAARSAIYEGIALLGRLPFGSLALLVDFLWPLWDPRRQTLHDKLAGTVVLRGAPPR